MPSLSGLGRASVPGRCANQYTIVHHINARHFTKNTNIITQAMFDVVEHSLKKYSKVVAIHKTLVSQFQKWHTNILLTLKQ